MNHNFLWTTTCVLFAALNLYWNAFLEYFFPQWYDEHHVTDEDIDDYNKSWYDMYNKDLSNNF